MMRKMIESVEVSEHTIKLQQMGAKVTVINSMLCYVSFELGTLDLLYVYNVNRKNNYFLERIKPYPLALDEFDSENDLVRLIAGDVEKFKNALNSSHINEYISMGKQVASLFSTFEDTFLNYNIPAEKFDKISKKILALEYEIDLIRDSAKRIFGGKE